MRLYEYHWKTGKKLVKRKFSSHFVFVKDFNGKTDTFETMHESKVCIILRLNEVCDNIVFGVDFLACM